MIPEVLSQKEPDQILISPKDYTEEFAKKKERNQQRTLAFQMPPDYTDCRLDKNDNMADDSPYVPKKNDPEKEGIDTFGSSTKQYEPRDLGVSYIPKKEMVAPP